MTVSALEDGIWVDDPNASSDAKTYLDALGRSYDAVLERDTGVLSVGETVEETIAPLHHYAPDTFEFRISENQTDYRKSVFGSAGARGRYGLFSGSASGSSSKSRSTTSYNLNLVGIVKLSKRSYTLNGRTEMLEENAKDAIAALSGQHAKLLRSYGDSYVASVATGAELLVDVRIQTRSKSEKKAVGGRLNAAFGSVVSGSARLSKVIQTAAASKAATVHVSGTFGSGVLMRAVSADEAQRILLEFPTIDPSHYFTRSLRIRPVREHRQLRARDWIVERDRQERQEFVDLLAGYFYAHEDTLEDIDYILGEGRDEFDADTLNEAREEKDKVVEALNQLRLLHRNASSALIDRGENGGDFDVRLLQPLWWNSPEFDQKEPVVARPTTRRRSRQRRRPEPMDLPRAGADRP